jgi:hypothetical protein
MKLTEQQKKIAKYSAITIGIIGAGFGIYLLVTKVILPKTNNTNNSGDTNEEEVVNENTGGDTSSNVVDNYLSYWQNYINSQRTNPIGVDGKWGDETRNTSRTYFMKFGFTYDELTDAKLKKILTKFYADKPSNVTFWLSLNKNNF